MGTSCLTISASTHRSPQSTEPPKQTHSHSTKFSMAGRGKAEQAEQAMQAENRALREENAKLKLRVAKLTKAKTKEAAAMATAAQVRQHHTPRPACATA